MYAGDDSSEGANLNTI